MILVRKRQPDGQHSHDRVSTKEHIRTIFDAPHFGHSTDYCINEKTDMTWIVT